MGDRANVSITGRYSGTVYLYTHWRGTELPALVAEVLAGRAIGRWDDPAYLARIVFSALIKDAIDDPTGFGISATVGDGDDRIVALDCDTQTITWGGRYHASFAEFAHRWHAFQATGATLPSWHEPASSASCTSDRVSRSSS